MGLFKNKKGSIISDYFKLLEDVGNFPMGNSCGVALYDNQLEITTPFKSNKITLYYNQITDVFHGCKTDLIDKPKSIIGRAVIGGALFGGAGAVVGAISGSGTKRVKSRHLYFIISFVDTDGYEKYLLFEDTRRYKGSKLAKKLRELSIGDVPKNQQEDIVL